MRLKPEQIWSSSLVRAYLVKRFLDGFCDVNPQGANILILFPAMQIASSVPLMSCVSKGKPSSLAEYVKCVVKCGYRHLLEGLPDAIMQSKDAILASILAAISTHLVSIELSSARLSPTKAEPRGAESVLPRELRVEGRRAATLGGWFGTITPRQAATILGFDIT